MNDTPLLTREHYHKLERIGAGGMGVVWKAEDTKLGRIVALKFLTPELTRDPDAKIRFVREARAAALLDHPNICTIHDVGETDEGETFIAMPYYEGSTLKQLIEAGPLALDRAMTIGAQIAHGLAKAHAAGIVHRDIKPANIIITNDGVAKILDFGLARLSDATSITRPQTTVGTLAYMAPEQLRGDIAGPAADIWSLGIVLFEMLTGRRPFSGEHGAAVTHAILHGETPSPTGFREDVPPRTAALLLRMLEKDPSRRIGSADEVAIRLEESRTSQPERPAGVESKTALQTARTSPRAAALRIAAIALTAIVVGAAAFWMTRDREESRMEPGARAAASGIPLIQTIAVLPLANPDAASVHVSDGITRHIVDELSTSPAFRVTALTSTLRFRNSSAEPRDIGRQLGVSRLLTGAFGESDGKYTLRVELIDAGDGAQIWGRDYVHDRGDVLGLQRRLIADLTRRLGLTRADRPPATQSAAAYDFYLRGRFLWNLRGRDNVGRAVEAFEEAVRTDPGFAQAWAGLALAYGTIAGNRYIPGTETQYQLKARAATGKALSLDPSNAEAWTCSAGSKNSYEWDFEGAEADFKRAIELNPSYATAHQWYAELLRTLGRPEEARAEIELAQQLDPFSPSVNMGVCFDRLRRREYRQALAEGRRLRTVDPTLSPGLCMYWCAILLGDYEGANALLRAANPALADEATNALKTGGLDAYWRVFIERAGEQHYAAAMAYSMLGDADSAFRELENAFEVKGKNFEEFYGDPRFDAIRHDLRFDELAKRVGLPQAQRKLTTKPSSASR